MKGIFQPNEDLLRRIAEALGVRGLSWQDSRRLAASTQRLSDYFISHPRGTTPWKESWAQEAYLSYYLPLNETRVSAVVAEGQRRGFFTGLKHVIDFGAGPGTASESLHRVAELEDFNLVEIGAAARTLLAPPVDQKRSWFERIPLIAPERKSATLFVASYSLTEAELPAVAESAEALMLIEPSTQEDGRLLLALRDRLREKGFHLWAPCTHQQNCPLLTQSKRDWCHDRIHLELPEPMRAIESHLPFKNRTLTFSYLLARRTPAPILLAGAGRLVGDLLEEKGKSRQMLCRGEEREFLAWLHRDGPPQEMARGEVVVVPANTEKVAQELRPRSPLKTVD